MTFIEKAKKLKSNIPAVFIALHHEKTPWFAKLLAGITLAYALSPIDLIPDFIPVLGYLDDVLILPLLVAWIIRLIPPEVFAECHKEAEKLWENGKPKKWYYAVPIVFIWLFFLVWVLKMLQ